MTSYKIMEFQIQTGYTNRPRRPQATPGHPEHANSAKSAKFLPYFEGVSIENGSYSEPTGIAEGRYYDGVFCLVTLDVLFLEIYESHFTKLIRSEHDFEF